MGRALAEHMRANMPGGMQMADVSATTSRFMDPSNEACPTKAQIARMADELGSQPGPMMQAAMRDGCRYQA